MVCLACAIPCMVPGGVIDEARLSREMGRRVGSGKPLGELTVPVRGRLDGRPVDVGGSPCRREVDRGGFQELTVQTGVVGINTISRKRFGRPFGTCVLTAALLFAMFAGVVFAQQSGSTQQSGSPFSDARGHWAERYITQTSLKGAVRGYADGTFKPDDSVTRLECVVMLVRVLGLESQAQSTTSIPSSFKNPEFVPSWGKGYVAVAVNKGIISGSDLSNFRGNEYATRLDVAVFALKALGLGDEAEKLSNPALSFTDLSQIPSWARGYVSVAEREGVMKGLPDGRFNPGGKVTRGEMATILSRLDDRLENSLDSRETRGTLIGLTPTGAQSITVRLSDGSVRTMGLSQGCVIYRGTTKLSISQLVIGDEIRVIVDSQGKAAFIDTPSYSDYSVVTGTIRSVTSYPYPAITVRKSDGAEKTYEIASSASIYVDSVVASRSDLQSGQTVTVRISDQKAVEIRAQNAETTVIGTLVSVITGGNPVITVKDSGDETRTFSVSGDCTVKRDGENVSLSSLVYGDKVTLTVRGSTVFKINAEAQDFDVEGTFVKIDYTNPPKVVVDVDGERREFTLDVDASVKRNGRTSSLASLRAGDEVTLSVRKGEVTKIVSEVTEESQEGTVQKITIAQVPEITVLTPDGEEKTYPVSAQAVIRKDRTRIQLNEINPGSYVDMDIESGEVMRIDVEPYTVLDDVKGTVEYVVESANVIVVSTVVDGATSSQTREIHVTGRTLFVRGDTTIDFDDLNAGDRIIAVGSRSTGIFIAKAIVVLTVSE